MAELAAYWKRIKAMTGPHGALLRFHLLTGAQPARKAGNSADLECAALPQPEPETAKAQQKMSAPSGISRLQLQKETLVP